MRELARVFVTRTNMCPLDFDTYFGAPDLFTPYYKEVHISVSFTWDIEHAKFLKTQWKNRARKVRIGGPAVDGEPKEPFTAGKYLKNGVTITSRGCPKRCPFCLISQDLIELETFPEGNIVQDNNLLACSNGHLDRVFSMLSNQSMIDLRGGIDTTLLTDKIIDRIRGLRLDQLWLSFDMEQRRRSYFAAVQKLKKYFTREKIRTYVLIGYKSDTFPEAENRLRFVYEMGSLPFAMLYRGPDGKWPQPQWKWRKFQKMWSRPAIYKRVYKKGQRVSEII